MLHDVTLGKPLHSSGSGFLFHKEDSTIAWKIPWTKEPGRLHIVQGVAESDTTERQSTHSHMRQSTPWIFSNAIRILSV